MEQGQGGRRQDPARAGLHRGHRGPSTRTRQGRPPRARGAPTRRRWRSSAARYPQDREAAIFYALALNITSNPNDKTYAKQLKAAAILEPIFAEQPEHPGVAHYLIHSYDYPPIAEQGLPRRAPLREDRALAPHALHMPSHIFTRLGYWEDSIDTNRRSVEAAKEELRQAKLEAGSYNALHAMDYIVVRRSAAREGP